MAETIHRALDAIYLACIWVAGACIFLMSLFIPWGIFSRYVLGTGSQWPEPISILLMVVFTFLGAACSYRAGAHIAVAMLTDRLPDGVRAALRALVHLLMLTVSLFMLWYGVQLCIGTWGQSIPELPWMPVGFTYLPVPIGGAITALFVLEHLFLGDQSRRAVVTFDHEAIEAEAV
ncbi:MAG: C4-dicarboxylate ABC transporter [Burkholderiales bacterium RIFCSPLOWO2_12_67_14]|nr:MAG: C4-dicarboxylate ABC transporter [Burkholderiales bacterium RIFCSPLOWO2_02_FULL_67_64]OGB42679.1 MAG: C4-dicarboxylate ABC transporter [Burkholderiales bacterium RIFCSPHIGHO2_12_FULL_67_38]OGB43180.1 MAG: C4-dicarboxylate ABC transporter [Burkholderiales bacterium RIFCSPLOWO2_12_67_14]